VRRRQRTPKRRRDPRGVQRQRTIEGTRPSRHQSPQPVSQGLNVRGVINTIAGSFAGRGSTSTARKKHLRFVQSVNAISQPLTKKMPPITFTNAYFKGVDPRQDDSMVITVEIENFTVMKTLVDQGSSVDILCWSMFRKLKIPEGDIQAHEDQIVDFSGERVDTRGYIDLYTKFRDERSHTKSIKIHYLLVEASTSYNVLLSRSSLNTLGAIVSTPYLAMKFPSPMGDIITVHVGQKVA